MLWRVVSFWALISFNKRGVRQLKITCPQASSSIKTRGQASCADLEQTPGSALLKTCVQISANQPGRSGSEHQDKHLAPLDQPPLAKHQVFCRRHDP